MEQESAPVVQCAVVEVHHCSLPQRVAPPAQPPLPLQQQAVSVEQQAVAVGRAVAVGQAVSVEEQTNTTVSVAVEHCLLSQDLRRRGQPHMGPHVPPAQHAQLGTSEALHVEKQQVALLVFPMWLSEEAHVLLVGQTAVLLEDWAAVAMEK